MRFKYLNNISKVILFAPLLIYVGQRSYIAYDEGFYTLQAKWILQNNNWIIPLWWDKYILDRTIGIQFLIAKSQQLLGETSFAAHLPTTISAGLMLFFTYKLHQQLINKKDAIISSIILATTYIWLDFSHLATQDMVFACLVTLAIYTLTKLNKETNHLYEFAFGCCIGLGFMLKTFLIAIPFICLCPYIYYKKEYIKIKYLIFGISIGLLPFAIWTLSINQYLNTNIILLLLDKLLNLSSNNTFTNPFYYYLWNIPINFLPWSIFSIIGITYQLKKNVKINYLLFYFPLIFIFIISFFSTKTPYYILPISSILALNAYIGIKTTLEIKNPNFILNTVIAKIIPIFIFLLITFYLVRMREFVNLNSKEELFIFIGLTFFSISWFLVNLLAKTKYILLVILIGPYFLGSCITQSGLLTDRSRDIRESVDYIFSKKVNPNEIIYVDLKNIKDDELTSKLIKISLLTPNLGKSIEGINNLKISELAWTSEAEQLITINNSHEVIYTDKNLNPWKLVKKKI